MAETFDAVLIGAGHNALAAALHLSAKGWRVGVFEQAASAGGAVKTGEYTLPGFRHDVMAATWVLFMTSPAGAALGPHLARHGFEYCHTAHPTAVLRPDGSSLVLTTDRAANVKAFDAIASGDGARHAADVGGIEADAPFLFSLLGGDLWSWPTLKLLVSQAFKRGPRGLAAWFGSALVPARGWLETGYQSPLIQALFAPWVLHCGLTPESTYSGKMGQVVAFALEAAGAPVVKGGSGQAVAAFRALIEEHGGEIRTNADVDEILTANYRTTGVRLTSGETIPCTSVLASVAPDQLATRLLRSTPAPATKTAARTFRHGRGNFQLHYALDRHPEWLAAGLDDVALIHLSDGIDSVSKSANEAERGLLPATPTICVGQPHRLDPTRCPDGKAILWMQIPDAPRHAKGDAAGEITPNGWDDTTREAFSDRIEAILSRHIKDFAAIKLSRRAYSPADLNALNINLVGGDPYGGLCSIDQFFLFRPFAAAPDLPKGLSLIGASTHPGPGLGGGSGFIAANRLLSKRGRA